jgi:hypothetical protein
MSNMPDQARETVAGMPAGAGIIPPGSHGDKPHRWILGTTRRYRTLFLPDHGFTVYLPAPFHTYTYGPDGHINPTPTTRHG